MKITDLTVTMVKWESEPWLTGVGTTFGGHKLLGSYDRKWCMERMREVAYPAG